MEIEESCSSSTVELPDSFKIPRYSKRRTSMCNFVPSDLRTSVKVRKQRNPSPFKPNRPKAVTYDHPMPICNSKKPIVHTFDAEVVTKIEGFHKRDITTIHEEECQHQKGCTCTAPLPMRIRVPRPLQVGDRIQCSVPRRSHKKYKEKVASLKVIIRRLKKTYLTNPEVIKTNIPEETIQLFEKIHI